MRRCARQARARALAGAAAIVLAAAPPSEATERRFVLREDGLGPVVRGVPIDLAALRAAYPEFEIKPLEVMREGLPETRLRAAEDDAPAFEITLAADGSFYEIHAMSPRIAGPFGGRTGLFFEDLPIEGSESCFAMVDEWRAVACPSTKTEGLQFLFRPPRGAVWAGDRVAGLRLY